MSGSSSSAACGRRWAPEARARALEARALEARALEARALEARALEARALEARALGASVALRGAPFRAGGWDLCVLAALMLWPFALAGAGLGALLWAEPGKARA